MCGIFAYIGNREAASLLITALKRLEYRGYDSAGIGIHGVPLKVRKKAGKVSNLEEDVAHAGTQVSGTLGIAHTRWATHGKPTDCNAHPQTTAESSIAVVHNGVIENYAALKEQLSSKGYKFVSQTDTELLAHLVQDMQAVRWPNLRDCLLQDLKKQMEGATYTEVVATALRLCEGAYGVAFIFQDEPDLIIGARKGSPLILGVGHGEHMLASDASAIIEHTKDVVYLREGELVEIRRSGFKVSELQKIVSGLGKNSWSPRKDGENPIVRLELSLEQIEKGGFKHFMLKEIMDQPNAMRNALRGRIYQPVDMPEKWEIKLGGLEKAKEGRSSDGTSPLERMANSSRLIFAACGTSWHSSLIAKYAFEKLAGVTAEVEYASEFRYRKPLICKSDCLIAISQSGETADTLEAIKMAKHYQALTIGVVNVVGSSIARETDAGMYLHAGPEIGVASTKAFTCQVVALLLMALRLGKQRGVLSETMLNSYCAALNSVPDSIERWLSALTDQTRVVSKYFRLATNAIFSGMGIHYPVALEGALKLKEISYIHAEGFPASEIRHGSITLVRNFVPVICVAMRSDPAYEDMKQMVKDFRDSFCEGKSPVCLFRYRKIGKPFRDQLQIEPLHMPESHDGGTGVRLLLRQKQMTKATAEREAVMALVPVLFNSAFHCCALACQFWNIMSITPARSCEPRSNLVAFACLVFLGTVSRDGVNRRMGSYVWSTGGVPSDGGYKSFWGLSARLVSLVGKRFTDKVRRPWKVWFFDTAKQGTQALMNHIINIGLSMGFGEWLSVDADPCNWYWINMSLDCTLGVGIMFLLLRLLQCVYRSKLVARPELARCGHYGDPPDFKIFLRQLLDWQALVFVQKLMLAALVINFRASMALISTALLGWLDDFPRAKLVVVMVLMPLILNVFALWTADSFLQAKANDCDEVQVRESLVAGIPAVVGRDVPAFHAQADEDLEDSIMSFQEWKRSRRQA
ncbi:glmS [Symbiodinium sp. CCMP2456]|nr:glmS [Symbiodinium sp. CCMP2456]